MKCSLGFCGCTNEIERTERRRTGYTEKVTTYGYCHNCLTKRRRWNRKRLVEPRHYMTSLAAAIWPDTFCGDAMTDKRRLEDARRYRARHPKKLRVASVALTG